MLVIFSCCYLNNGSNYNWSDGIKSRWSSTVQVSLPEYATTLNDCLYYEIYNELMKMWKKETNFDKLKTSLADSLIKRFIMLCDPPGNLKPGKSNTVLHGWRFMAFDQFICSTTFKVIVLNVTWVEFTSKMLPYCRYCWKHILFFMKVLFILRFPAKYARQPSALVTREATSAPKYGHGKLWIDLLASSGWKA